MTFQKRFANILDNKKNDPWDVVHVQALGYVHDVMRDKDETMARNLINILQDKIHALMKVDDHIIALGLTRSFTPFKNLKEEQFKLTAIIRKTMLENDISKEEVDEELRGI